MPLRLLAYRLPVFYLPNARPPDELFGIYAAEIPIRHIRLSALDGAYVFSEGVIYPLAWVVAFPAVFGSKRGTEFNGLVFFFFGGCRCEPQYDMSSGDALGVEPNVLRGGQPEGYMPVSL